MLGRLTFPTWCIIESTPIASEIKSHKAERESSSFIIRNRINQNTKNNSNNSNSERPKASLVVRMAESHGTQHYLHYIAERSVIFWT